MRFFQPPLIGSRELVPTNSDGFPNRLFFRLYQRKTIEQASGHILCLFKWIICLINFRAETLRIHHFN